MDKNNRYEVPYKKVKAFEIKANDALAGYQRLGNKWLSMALQVLNVGTWDMQVVITLLTGNGPVDVIVPQFTEVTIISR